MEGWFSGQIENTVTSAVEIAKQHHQWMKDYASRVTDDVQEKMELSGSSEKLEDSLEDKRKEYSVFSIKIVDRDGKSTAQVESAAAVIEDFQEPDLNISAIQRAISQKENIILTEEKDSHQFIRVYKALNRTDRPDVLIVSIRVDPEISHAMTEVNDSFKEYEQMKIFRSPLRSSYILTLSMITGLILFAAIWFGFYIAREISVPIQRLAEGTRAVARGNFDFEIPEVGDDEMAFLVKSFNNMTKDIKYSRAESDERRVYIETILAHLAVGVIAVDSAHLIKAVNPAASKLFSLNNNEVLSNVRIDDLLDQSVLDQIAPLLAQIERKQDSGSEIPTKSDEKEISVLSSGRELRIVCTAGRVLDAQGRWLTTVLIFDDITDLVKAQHMSAWREVARRIAHEIKNPLTPIQLSAQRLQKLLAGKENSPAVDECTQLIVENVDSIKRLANEFSNFARMPTAELKNADLNSLISDSIIPFAEQHNNIVFQFVADNKLPEVSIDIEQFRRLMINLIDNAIAAFVGEYSLGNTTMENPRVVIRTLFNKEANTVTIEVADNGIGIKDLDKVRIFEPYFTTKSGGTGLGLAIVTSVVADHQGEIRVYDNSPRGAKFVVELPVSPKVMRQRKIGNIV